MRHVEEEESRTTVNCGGEALLEGEEQRKGRGRRSEKRTPHLDSFKRPKENVFWRIGSLRSWTARVAHRKESNQLCCAQLKYFFFYIRSHPHILFIYQNTWIAVRRGRERVSERGNILLKRYTTDCRSYFVLCIALCRVSSLSFHRKITSQLLIVS